MRKLGLVALATLISTGAFAGDHTITGKGRIDWRYQDNDEKKTLTSNSSSLDVSNARLYFAGVVTPTVKYTLTTNLLSANSANDSTDGTSGFLKEFYLTKNLAEGFNAMFGKQAVVFGSRENDYAARDLYTVSEVINNTPSEQVALTLSYDVAGQNFQVQAFNGNKKRGTGANAQTRMGYGAIWYGNFANGMVKPIVAYTILPQDSVKGTDWDYLTSGLQFNMSSFTVEADWNQVNKKDVVGTTDVKTTSMVGLVRYNHDHFMPFIKYIKDETKKDATVTNTKERTAWDFGVEYKENKEDALKYHAVYSTQDVKLVSGTKSKPKQIVVGLTFDAAIMK